MVRATVWAFVLEIFLVLLNTLISRTKDRDIGGWGGLGPPKIFSSCFIFSFRIFAKKIGILYQHHIFSSVCPVL